MVPADADAAVLWFLLMLLLLLVLVLLSHRWTQMPYFMTIACFYRLRHEGYDFVFDQTDVFI